MLQEKPLRITGNPQQVEHAKQLVYELIAEKEMQYGGGPRGGGGGPNKPPGNNSSNWGSDGGFDQQSDSDGHDVRVVDILSSAIIGYVMFYCRL